MSEKLWNAAYDSLETDNAELVILYVKTLDVVLGANPGVAPDTNISAELYNPTKRQMHMRRMVEEVQAKISKASKIMNGVGDVAGFVLSVKGLIDLAVQSVPQAALRWAGVCVGLQVTSRPSNTPLCLALLTCLQLLQNPAQATKSNLAGIAHIISRMNWYCALTEHLLSKRAGATPDTPALPVWPNKSLATSVKVLIRNGAPGDGVGVPPQYVRVSFQLRCHPASPTCALHTMASPPGWGVSGSGDSDGSDGGSDGDSNSDRAALVLPNGRTLVASIKTKPDQKRDASFVLQVVLLRQHCAVNPNAPLKPSTIST